MSTNYYAHTRFCHCCGKPENAIHLGKSSVGWHFTFRAHPRVRSFIEFLEMIFKPGVKIVDEYETYIDPHDLVALILNKAKDPENRPIELNNKETMWTDKQGHVFCDYDFC